MSSKLIPPKEGCNFSTIFTNFSGSGSSIHKSTHSTPANFLNSTDLPSMTGLLASAPMLPRPKTAVPFEIQAQKFALFVNL
jgi:hypothetical protein